MVKKILIKNPSVVDRLELGKGLGENELKLNKGIGDKIRVEVESCCWSRG